MKFLIDESVEKPIVDWLRDQKYDVMYVAESSSGITDEEVIRFANSETRILITNDKDFGELIFRLLGLFSFLSLQWSAATVAISSMQIPAKRADTRSAPTPCTFYVIPEKSGIQNIYCPHLFFVFFPAVFLHTYTLYAIR